MLTSLQKVLLAQGAKCVYVYVRMYANTKISKVCVHTSLKIEAMLYLLGVYESLRAY